MTATQPGRLRATHGRREDSIHPIAALALVLVLACPLVAAAEGRVALVIGNGNYESLDRLRNPASDAKLIARTLRTLQFDVVEQSNMDERAMKLAIQDFGRRIQQGGRETVSVFYYAGHGVQVNGVNYLLPVKAKIQREPDVEIEAVDAGLVLRQMEDAGSRINVVILDACRNNPLPRGLRGVSRGLASINAPQGSLIAYSTAPGSVSMDGEGENSPYTQALARAMGEPGLTVEEMFRRVRVSVLDVTRGQQVAWESSSLTGAFYFRPGTAVAGGSTPSVAAGSPAPSQPTVGPRTDLLASMPGQQRETGISAPDSVTAPRPPGAAEIAGRWEGRYQCQRDEVGLILNIAAAEGNRVSAIFEFYPLPGTFSFQRGSFRMQGEYDRTDSSIRLQGTDWVNRSVGFQRHSIEGQLAQGGTAINGRILTPGCAHFVLMRR